MSSKIQSDSNFTKYPTKPKKSLRKSDKDKMYKSLDSMTNPKLTFAVEDTLDNLAQTMPPKAFKVLVATSAPVWIPAFVVARTVDSAQQWARAPFTSDYYQFSSPGKIIAKAVTAPVVSAIGIGVGTIGGLTTGTYKGVKLLVLSMKL